MLSSPTEVTEAALNGFLRCETTAASDTANVLGRVDKDCLRRVVDILSFNTVFSTLCSLRHGVSTASPQAVYITRERNTVYFKVHPRDRAKLAEFCELVADGKVDGFQASEREKQSLWIFAVTLRFNNGNLGST